MTGTVLIVDDSLTVRMNLADAFEAASFRVIACATIAEARAAVASVEADILVLDVNLPDGDGLDLLREIRGRADQSQPAVLMLSSEAEVKDRILGLKTGADEFVGKPYDVGYLIARSRELVRARRSSIESGTSVLVIDDSSTYRAELRECLEAREYIVHTAASGEEGLRMAADRRPDAIIIDGVLPGIDGTTVIRRLRLDAALRGVPCLLLTGADDLGAELRALDAGADAFVKKGQDTDIICARLAAVLRQARSPAIAEDTASLLAPKRILAVDDSPTFLQAVGDALRHEGYEVILARGGDEALDLLAVQSVDCILLDLVMPGLSGEDTCRRIKSAAVVRDIPLIILTGADDQETMIRSLSAGADDYISKSDEFEVLTARVRAQIRRKQFEDENRRIRDELLKRELEAAETRSTRELAGARAAMVEELERKNQELEAFSYSVSHDLRAPLRTIDGFSHALLDEFSGQLDAQGQDFLRRVRAAAQRMGELIDALLGLSRIGRSELGNDRVDLSALASTVADELRRSAPHRRVDVVIQDGLLVQGDGRLLRVMMENLLSNAWKFTEKVDQARIELGVTEVDRAPEYFVRDNGAGFAMAHADKLFRPFQRLHRDTDFPGTGIGLATIRRIVERHSGRITAEGAVDEGATFRFTIPSGHKGRSAE